MGAEVIASIVVSAVLAIWGVVKVGLRRRKRRRMRLEMDEIDAQALSAARAFELLRHDSKEGD